uniref:J domain-containing protein n=1 Tax=Fagus sylvatica TaxID=28930 RepID=A0A2N9F9E7_FAGSY
MKMKSGIILFGTIILIVLSVSLLITAEINNYYKVLGVERNATPSEIKKAFYSLSLLYHPDKNHTKEAKQKYIEIREAYDILKEKIKSFSGDQLPKRADYTVEDCGEINSYRREAGSICSVGPINRFMCLKQLPNQTNTINQTILELNPRYCL